MNPQRKIEIDVQQAPVLGASPIPTPLGGQVGLWQEQLARHYAVAPVTDPLEAVVFNVSRWSGPAIFVLTLACLVYWL